MDEGELILAAAYRMDLDLPSHCLEGWCLTCAGRVEGPGEWDQSAARRYFRHDREEGFVLLCTARACSDLTLRTHQREPMHAHRVSRLLPAPRDRW